MKLFNHEQRSEAWYAWRKTKLTASESASIMTKHFKKFAVLDAIEQPEKTAFMLYAEKIGLLQPEDLSRNPYVRHGIAHEDDARAALEDAMNRENPSEQSPEDITGNLDDARLALEETLAGEFLVPVCGELDSHPFIAASLDGITSTGVPTELKCPSKQNFEHVVRLGEKSEVYQRYWPQVQHQILVAGSTQGILSFWFPGEKPVYFTIEADPEYHRLLIEEAEKFQRSLENLDPPEMDPQRDIFIPGDQERQRLWLELAEQYRHIAQKIESLNQQTEDLRRSQNDLLQGFIQQMGDFCLADFGRVRIKRFMRQGSMDYQALIKKHLPDLDPSTIEMYRKAPVSQVRVTLKESPIPDRMVNPELLEIVQDLESEFCLSF